MASNKVLISDIARDGCKEIVFPVPWGIIAAKAWGDPCCTPVLLLHGIQDNAGSFDRLIDFLPRSFYYVALDFPGHGLSSRIPNGFNLDIVQLVLSVDRVIRQLKWSRFSLIGHSLGGQITIVYTAMFPEKVKKFVIIDSAGPYSVEAENYMEHIRQQYEGGLNIEEKMSKASPPSYSYDDALDRCISSRRGFISKEAAEKLVTRNLKSGKNGYYFSTDQRLKLSVPLYQTFDQMSYHMRVVRCPSLAIVTELLNEFVSIDVKKTRKTKGKLPTSSPAHYYKTLSKNPKFKVVVVQGSHDIHNNSPEIVAPYIVEFLLHQKSSL